MTILKKCAIAATVFILVAGNAFSSLPSVTEVDRASAHRALMAVSFDDEFGIAVGTSGQIKESKDAGDTWEVKENELRLGLLGVDVKGEVAIAVGQLGQILLRNSDENWEPIESGTEERLLSVSIGNGDQEAAAVGSFGAVVMTRDGGKTWASIAPDWEKMFPEQGFGFAPHLYAVQMLKPGEIFLAGEMGLVLRSDDYGASWALVRRGKMSANLGEERSPSIFALHIRDDGIGYAVGQEGTILQTRDHGMNWLELNSGTKSILLGVSSESSGSVLVVGRYAMLASPDDGSSWISFSDPKVISAWYSGVDRAGAGEGKGVIVVGDSGLILKLD